MFLDPGAIRHVARIGVKFGGQVAQHHRAPIPFQPEPYPLCSRLVLARSVWPQVIPVIMIAVAAFTQTARFPPEQLMALFTSLLCSLCQGRKKAIDACGVLYMSAYLIKAELYEDRSRSYGALRPPTADRVQRAASAHRPGFPPAPCSPCGATRADSVRWNRIPP